MNEPKLQKLLCPEQHDTLTIISAALANGKARAYCSTCRKEYVIHDLISQSVDRNQLPNDGNHPTVYGKPN